MKSTGFGVYLELPSLSKKLSGVGQTNLIAVVSDNNILNLYVNHQLINTQQESTFSS